MPCHVVRKSFLSEGLIPKETEALSRSYLVYQIFVYQICSCTYPNWRCSHDESWQYFQTLALRCIRLVWMLACLQRSLLVYMLSVDRWVTWVTRFFVVATRVVFLWFVYQQSKTQMNWTKRRTPANALINWKFWRCRRNSGRCSSSVFFCLLYRRCSI